RLVVELRDKIKLVKGARGGDDARRVTGLEAEAISALVNLGYRRTEAERAVKAARAAGASDIEAVIRTALKRVAA
ncbi:MAG TPA: hypothetical protein VN812_13100, partial [Candidatus Acidoferrales bacterium]|nr:hypothetical protein [Candidatus Acidoferrales bacterium]